MLLAYLEVSPGWQELVEFDKAGALCFFISTPYIILFYCVDCSSDNNTNQAIIIIF